MLNVENVGTIKLLTDICRRLQVNCRLCCRNGCIQNEIEALILFFKKKACSIRTSGARFMYCSFA